MRTRRMAISRSRVQGVGYGMTLNDCKVTGYRGEFGPAERAGVQVGWDIVGVSGTMVDSMETLAAALDLCPDGTPVDFLFRVPEELGGRRRGRGRNEEIARFQHRGESGG